MQCVMVDHDEPLTPTAAVRASTGDVVDGRATDDDAFSDIDADVEAFVERLRLPRAEPVLDGAEPVAGTRIAERFEVTRTLGRGGMGLVVLAHDPALRREVAIKLVASTASRPLAVLEREARAMAMVVHPNVLVVHEIGRHEDGLFIAMEYVDGETLRRWLAREPRTAREIVAKFIQAARGLHAAHAAGLVHRDFKPDNVLVGRDGRVRVADFGLAREVRDDDARRHAAPTIGSESADALGGTPGYMAPEQFADGTCGPASDQFAFGVAMYEALCNARPYPTGVWNASAQELRPLPSSMPRWLRRVVARTVALDPAERFADLATVADALERGIGERTRARRWLALGAGLGLSAAGALALRGEQPCVGDDPRLTALWSEPRRAAITEAFARSVAHGDEIAATTVHWLDRHVEQIATVRREVCLAARVHDTLGPTMFDRANACLDARLDALAGVLDAFTDASDAVVRDAEDALARLRSPATCGDAAILAHAVSPPDDPEIRERVAEYSSALVRLRSSLFARPLADSIETLEEILALARRTGHAPTIAQAQHVLAEAVLEAGDNARATALTREAYFAARAAGDHQQAARSAAALAYLAGVTGDDADVALIWLDHVRADLIAKTATPELEVDVESVAGQVLVRAGRPQDAIGHFRAAIDAGIREGVHAHKLAIAFNELATALDATGALDEALINFDEGLALAERELGAHNTTVAFLLNNRGQALTTAGRFHDAIADLERALAIERALWGDAHAGLLAPLLNLGIATGAAGRHEVAARHLEAAMTYVADDEDRALVLGAQGWLASTRGDTAAALKLRRATLELHQARPTPDDAELAIAHTHLADSLIDSGEPEAAALQLQQALDAWRSRSQRDDPREAQTWLELAEAELARGRPAAAEGAAASVIELADRIAVEPAVVAGARRILARATPAGR